MLPSRIDIQPGAGTKRLLPRLSIVRVGYRKLALEDKMCRQAAMSGRWVIGVAGTHVQPGRSECYENTYGPSEPHSLESALERMHWQAYNEYPST